MEEGSEHRKKRKLTGDSDACMSNKIQKQEGITL